MKSGKRKEMIFEKASNLWPYFCRRPFAEVAAGEELRDENRLDPVRVFVAGDELEY